jgi:hypothetical protein
LADKRLLVIEQAAKQAGVSYDGVHKIGDHPWEEIIKTATDRGCDVIFMASHGRRGGSGCRDRQRNEQGSHAHQNPRARVSLTRQSPGPAVGPGRQWRGRSLRVKRDIPRARPGSGIGRSTAIALRVIPAVRGNGPRRRGRVIMPPAR